MPENQRPLWIIIFAILLASIAIRTKAASPESPEMGCSNALGDDTIGCPRGLAERPVLVDTVGLDQ